MDDARHPYIPGVTDKPKPPPAPKVCDPVFHGASVWITNMDDFAIEYLPLMDGFNSLVMQTLDGLRGVPVRIDRMAQFRAAGKRVLSWSWCTDDNPRKQAENAAWDCDLYGFDGHWANAEKAFDSNGGRVAASAEWLDGWFGYWKEMGRRPAPLGVSPEPFSGIDHGAWQAAGAAYGPQAYTAENGATIGGVVGWGIKCGWDTGQIVPLIEPVIDGKETSTRDYVRDSHSYGCPGLVLYPGDQLVGRPDVWAEIAKVGRA